MKHKILVVDDQPLVLNVLKEILSRGPYTVYCAESANQALKLLEHKAMDVVISDERMPGMPGSEFLSIVRKRYPDTIRIILTGHASLESAIRAINQGEIYRFLTKPCNSGELHEVLRTALEKCSKGNRDTKEQNYCLISSLEKQVPGITKVKRDDNGVISINDENCF